MALMFCVAVVAALLTAVEVVPEEDEGNLRVVVIVGGQPFLYADGILTHLSQISAVYWKDLSAAVPYTEVPEVVALVEMR